MDSSKALSSRDFSLGFRTTTSAETFEPLWEMVCCWQCYFYVTDGWKVYPSFIKPEDHIISKTYMTRVEGENTRLRHYLARLQCLTARFANEKHYAIPNQ